MNAAEIRARVESLVQEYGHLQVATCAWKSLTGYALASTLVTAGAKVSIPEEIRIHPQLRAALGQLVRDAGHDAFCSAMTVLVHEYAARGARAFEVDALTDPEGHQTAAPPACPGCRERLAGLGRWNAAVSRARAAAAKATAQEEATTP